MDMAKGIALTTFVVGGTAAVIWAFWPRRSEVLRGLGGRCGPGDVSIPPKLALGLLEYHGGQGTALYAVGSSGYAGKCVPAPLVEEAISELGTFGKGVGSAKAKRLRKALREFVGKGK